jgi:pimeloyl-ACP methyl ester carboxylesterase
MRQLRRDGVALFYEEAGGGELPLVFVHGWCCDHTYFAPQFEHFRRKHRVVAVDLRGHGQSGKPHQSYTMEGFADDVAWMCYQLGVEKPVLIGHSMGGIVAFDLACRYPTLPSAIVMLDAAVVLPGGARAAAPHLIEALRGPDYREVQRQYVANSLFIPTDDQQRKERILQDMSSAPQQMMVSTMESLRDYDAAAVAEGCAVPALYIAADEPQPRTDMGRLHELLPRLMDGKTVGSGHFCQLEVPEQVNPMIERFLAVALRDRSVAAS